MARRIFNGLVSTLRFWMETEIHVYAFSIAANVLLSFFPFLIVSVSLGGLIFSQQSVINALDLALRDFFPSAMGDFMRRNLPAPQPVELFSIFILLFTSNGVFEPLEVAFNRIWGIRTNRSFLRNQAISLVLIFVCGGLVLFSLSIAAVQQNPVTGFAVERWMNSFFYKTAAVPVTVLVLYLVYRYLPNGKPPLARVLPAAVGVGLLLEGLKALIVWLGPYFDAKLQREYGVFRYSATLILLSFFTSMLVLAGAEWAARGHKFDKVPAAT
jgi:YihY family inner membrane protein